MADYPSWVKPHLRQRLEQERVEKSTQNKHPDAKSTPTPGLPNNPQPTQPKIRPGSIVRVVNNHYDWWTTIMDRYDGQWVTVDTVDYDATVFTIDAGYAFDFCCVVEIA